MEAAMMHVADLMTPRPVTLRENETLGAARERMERMRIRHLPIVDRDGVFLGLLTHRDLLAFTISKLAGIDDAAQAEIDAGIVVSEVMRRDVAVASPGVGVRQAAQIMLDNKFGCLPVLEDDKVVGILTEADFLKLAIGLMDELDRMRGRAERTG